jgi:pimeloyl-ACP methyl ester carboxylesterase
VLHGGPGGSGLAYSVGTFAEELEKKYAMVYLDQRGQGMAQGKYAESDVTVARLTEDVFALVKALKFKFGENNRIVIYGHSWGGLLGSAFMINADYEKEVDAWIESNGAHDLPLLNKSAVQQFINVGNEQIAKGNSTEQWNEIIDWANAVDQNNITDEVSGQINEKAFQVEEYLQNDNEINQSIGGLDIGSLLFGPTNILTSFITGNTTNGLLNDEIEATALTNQLTRITKPCLFLYSKFDFVVPKELGETAFQNVSSSKKRLVIFDRSGHSPMDNEPNLYVEEVVNFIDSL